MSDPIERYLDELRGRTPRRCRSRLVAEVREHLLDDAARLREQGLGDLAAETRAVERLGGPLTLANAERRLGLAPALAMAALIAALAGLGGFVLAERSSAVRDHAFNGAVKLADRGARSVSCDAGSTGTLVSIDNRTGAVRAIWCTAELRFWPEGSGDPIEKVVIFKQGGSLDPLVVQLANRAANTP